MDPVQKAGDNHVERVAALEEYLTLTSAHEGETWFRCRGLDRGPRARGTSPRPGHATVAAGSPGYPDNVWVYVQAGIGYGDVGDHAGALECLTTGLELALRTGEPEPALEQLRTSRASCLSAPGRPPGEIQERAAHGEQGKIR